MPVPYSCTVTSIEPMDDYAERLQKSREFGAAHRANVEASIAQQEAELEALRNDHAVLRAVIQQRSQNSSDYALPISADSGEILQSQRISPIVALALLELIAMRRNIVFHPEEESVPLLENVMRLAQLNWLDRNMEPRFEDLTNMHAMWAIAEDGLSKYYQATTKNHQPPRRCSRCLKVKLAGSGHGRSACDDGIAVSLSVPYPATSPVAVLSDIATDVSD